MIIGEEPIERFNDDQSGSEDEIDSLGKVYAAGKKFDQQRQLTSTALTSERKLDDLCELSMNYSFL